MDERDFLLLSVLNETKNITQAAERLGVTQSSLSKRINAIEEDLGVSLMLRSRSGIRFTPEGEAVLDTALSAKSLLDHLREALRLGKNTLSGTLRLGVASNYALYVLPEILDIYRRRYPQVNLHLDTSDSQTLYQKLTEGEIDIGILRGEFSWKEGQILLERERICIICHPAFKEKPLWEIPYIAHKSDPLWERELARWMRENNIHPSRHEMCVDSLITCVQMVSRGLGWAVVPEICLGGFSGDIRFITFANGEPFERSTYLLYANSAQELPQIRAFLDTVGELYHK